jgi:hypothetical protein
MSNWSSRALVAVSILAAATFYAWNFADLFPLIEYRQWIDNPVQWRSALEWFLDVALLHRWAAEQSRGLSLLVAGMFRDACGLSIVCHNGMHIALLLASAVLLAATLRRWVDPFITAGALVFFLFSFPVLDAAAWQATLLDKCAVLSAALLTYHVARSEPAAFTWTDQAILAVLTVIAVNAKEASWASVPSAALLGWVRSGDLSRTVLRFALPSAYFAWQVGYTMAYRLFVLPPSELARVMSADPMSNLSIYAGYLVGAALPVLALALAAALLAAWARPANRWLIVWAVVSFAGAITIPLRTTAQAPFYLLVPIFYLTIALALTFAAAPRSIAFRSAVAVVGLCLLTVQVSGYVRRYPLYGARAEMSRNFQTVLAAVRAQLGERRPELVTFQYPAGNHQAYMFVGSTGEHSHALARYISPPGADERDIAALRRIIRDAEAEKATAPRKGEMTVLLRADLSLERLTVTE